MGHLGERNLSKPRRAFGSAFTLIELMVSMAVLVLLVVMFAQALGSVSSAWSRAQKKMDNYAKARAMMNRLQIDLQNIVSRKDLSLFPDDGTNAEFSFYVRQRGVDGGAGATTRALSYVKYASGSQADDAGKLYRFDKSYLSDESPAFAPAATPTPSASPPPAPTPSAFTGLSTEADAPEILEGELGFAFGFLHPDGKYYPVFVRHDAAGHILSKASAVTVGVLVVDNRGAQLLADRNHLQTLINDFKLQSIDSSGQDGWSPRAIWERRLGLNSSDTGDNGSLISVQKYGAVNIDSIRAFERTFALPSAGP